MPFRSRPSTVGHHFLNGLVEPAVGKWMNHCYVSVQTRETGVGRKGHHFISKGSGTPIRTVLGHYTAKVTEWKEGGAIQSCWTPGS